MCFFKGKKIIVHLCTVKDNCLVDLKLSVTPEALTSTHLAFELRDEPHSHVDLF